jgi:hypothetical protein
MLKNEILAPAGFGHRVTATAKGALDHVGRPAKINAENHPNQFGKQRPTHTGYTAAVFADAESQCDEKSSCICYNQKMPLGLTGFNPKFDVTQTGDLNFEFVIDGTGVVKQITSVNDELKNFPR